MSELVELKLPKGKDYLSPSSSKYLYKHPVSYLAYVNDKFERNDGMKFGQFYEDVLYDIDNSGDFFIFDENKILKEAGVAYGKESKNIRATKPYKDLMSAIATENIGKELMTLEQADVAYRMKEIMLNSGTFEQYLDGETQVTRSGLVDTGEYIVKALVKSDAVLSSGIVNDLKTTSSTIDGWMSQAKKLSYDIQAYLTMELYNTDVFNFVVQRTVGMNEISIFAIHRDSWFFESGRNKLNRAVKNYIDFLSPEAEMLGVKPEYYVEQINII